jgi:GR25 family glycosyltransferase involved in LPS biosynthesis
MKINELVDTSYLINLDIRQDRLESSSKQLVDNNIDFQRFSAVDGNTLEHSDSMTPGQYGCYTSHLNVLKDCIENNIQTVAIFEDDVEFCENFEEKFSNIYYDIPDDWDIIYLGHNIPSTTSTPTASPNILKISGAYSLHAFILNRKAIEIALDGLVATPQIVDVYYAKIQSFLNAYGFVDQFCSQAPGWSDIAQAKIDYRWIYGWK